MSVSPWLQFILYISFQSSLDLHSFEISYSILNTQTPLLGKSKPVTHDLRIRIKVLCRLRSNSERKYPNFSHTFFFNSFLRKFLLHFSVHMHPLLWPLIYRVYSPYIFPIFNSNIFPRPVSIFHHADAIGREKKNYDPVGTKPTTF